MLNEQQQNFQMNPEQFADRGSKSDVYVSFDGKNKQLSHHSISLQQQFNENESLTDDITASGAHMRKNSTHKIISILDKISESQNERNARYEVWVPPNDENLLPNKEDSGIFVIPDSDGNEFEEKQTPTLGQKDEEQEHFMMREEQMMRNLLEKQKQENEISQNMT